MKMFWIGMICVSSIFGADHPVRELSTDALPFRNSLVPYLRHGYLIFFLPGAAAGSPISSIAYGFYAYAPNGKFAFNKNIEVAGGSQPVVRDLDFDKDGNAAVAATAIGGPSGFLNVILLLDHTGSQIGFIDTGRYVPAHLAIAADRSIWVLGWQQDANHPPYPDRNDYMIVRRFSVEGKEMMGFLPRSSFPVGLEPGAAGSTARLEVTKDRIGIIAYSGKTGSNLEWLDMDLNGKVVERFRLDDVVPHIASSAFTLDDRVYLSGLRGELYTLGPSSRKWKAVPKQGDVLLGADGNGLVYLKTGAGRIQLEWFNQPLEE